MTSSVTIDCTDNWIGDFVDYNFKASGVWC